MSSAPFQLFHSFLYSSKSKWSSPIKSKSNVLIVFSLAFSFVSYSSRCGFLFFLSFVKVTWDGRPQLLTYLIFFFSLFKHRQIVFSLAFSFVSYSSRRGFLFFFFLLSGSRGWEATIVDLSFFFLFSVFIV